MEHPRPDSILEAIFRLHHQGMSYDEVNAIIQDLDIQPTLTAHPTEVRRGSILFKQNRIAELLSQLSINPNLSEKEKNNIEDYIRQVF